MLRDLPLPMICVHFLDCLVMHPGFVTPQAYRVESNQRGFCPVVEGDSFINAEAWFEFSSPVTSVDGVDGRFPGSEKSAELPVIKSDVKTSGNANGRIDFEK